jgi:hypothetical protein
VDNLVELVLVGNTFYPMDLLNGLKQLKRLSLNLSYEVRRVLKLPQLEILKVHFVSVNSSLDISELICLNHFELWAKINETTILGKEKIYPLLETLITPFDEFVDKNIHLFKKLKTFNCKNFPINHCNLHKYLCVSNVNLISSADEWINGEDGVIAMIKFDHCPSQCQSRKFIELMGRKDHFEMCI